MTPTELIIALGVLYLVLGPFIHADRNPWEDDDDE